MGDLARSITKREVRRLAGDRYFERGQEYAGEGRVLSLNATSSGLSAVVRGEFEYEVHLADADGEVDYSCTCPIGEEGFFCKHCVAAALIWLEAREPKRRARSASVQALSLEEAVDYFLQQDRSVLHSTLLRWTQLNPWLEGRIFLHGAHAEQPASAARAALETFRKHLRPRKFSSEEEWLESFLSSCDMLEECLELGMAEMVIELCEAGLDAVATKIETYGLPDNPLEEQLLDTLQDLHLNACERAKPNPEALAERLFRWEMRSVCDIFFEAPKTYRKVLGPAGLQRFRELAEAGWAASSKNHEDGDCVTLLILLESLAELTGDVDSRIETMSRDLSAPFRYLAVAQVCLDAGRTEQAIDWAERGRRAFPGQRDDRLTVFLATRYRVAGQPDRALQVAFEEFELSPSRESYALLKILAEDASEPNLWIGKAVDRLRRMAEQNSVKSSRIPAGTLLVEALLDAGDAEEAWAAAERFGCTEAGWIELAERLKQSRPAEAGAVFLRSARASIERGARTSSYEEGVLLLEEAAAAMRRAGNGRQFHRALLEILKEHRAKRKLMSLIRERSKQLSP